MKRRLGWMGWAGAMTLLVGCATGPVRPAYVSPAQYQTMDCEALRLEFNRIGQMLVQGVEPAQRHAMGVGVGLGGVLGHGGGVYPSVSVRMGQSQNSVRTEIANLLGQRDALAQASRFKNCPQTLPLNSELPSGAPASN